jgi:hypothetical protein
LQQIASATLEVEKVKKERAESLRAHGWNNPWDLLTGAVNTSGMVLKRADVLGVGAATGVIVGAGAAGVGAAGRAVNTIGKASFAGVHTVIGVGSGVSKHTGRMLVTGVGTSSRAVTGVATGVAGGVVQGAKFVTAPVFASGKVVVKPVTKVVTGTTRTVGAIASTTCRVLVGAAGVATFGLVAGNRSPAAQASGGKVAAFHQSGDQADSSPVQSSRRRASTGTPTKPPVVVVSATTEAKPSAAIDVQ